ncbi:NEL-type E3 ubiquitin ligase domain-containing protein [Pseudomonas wayambapalatensis]|uniref:NEL-type E3 ubiquitin ligase domain-containing protein n=1 Tax=Pseudomonas wayambapalatensis TaxID=485895 RepID=UPI003CF90D4B
MTYAPHPESIDSLIASRLPAWLTGASLDRLRALQAAMTRQAKANEALKPILDAIPSLDAFAEPLIDAALRRRAIARPDVRYSTVKIRQRIVTPSISAALPAPTFTHVSRQTLLAAALHNYHVTETKPAPGRTGQLIDATGKHLGMGFEAFAGLCRTLDLGKAYQAVLAQQLRPSDSPAKVHGLFEESLAAHLEVAVRVAVLKGELDEQSYLELLPLIAPRPIVPPVSSSVIPRQLYLLGKCIRGVVTLEVRASPDAAVRGVIAWLPGDARQPVARYPSWAALYQALAEKLTDKSYRTFFSRFVSERDRPRFFSRLLELNRALGTGETLALDGRHQAIDGKLFAYLRELHIAKLFDDARVLAVPTGDEDEEDRRERLDAYLGLGLDVLNLAGLFVPLLGQAMLVVGALQIADEVYEGYLDWSVGDRQGALDHLFGVAENIAVGVAVGIGASAAREALQRVAFVDALVPLRNEAGALRLIDGRLPGYHAGSEVPADATQGRMLALPDMTLQVIDDPKDRIARARHPVREHAHRPQVHENGRGGWRHAYEQPQCWQGAGLILRRFGIAFSEVTDLLAEQLLQVTGFEQAQLRRLHLENAQVPARLHEVLERYQIHEQSPALNAADLDAQLIARQPLATAEDKLVLAAFAGLPIRCVREVLANASSAELDEMVSRQRLPLALAERARWSLREHRIDRACAGVRWPWASNADSERLVLGLIDQAAAWPSSVRIELRQTTADGALLASRGATDAATVEYVLRSAQGYQRQGSSLTSPDLLEVVLPSLDDTQRQALMPEGDSLATLREHLMTLAFADRAKVAELIGLTPTAAGLRPPRRFADGRLGYALSGRGESSREAIRRGIQQVFPLLNETQLTAYLENLTRAGEGLWEHYSRLQQQLGRLRQGLEQWRGQRTGPLDALRRRRVAAAIRRSWRRKLTDSADDYVLELDGEVLDSLPVLPVGIDFGHVRRLRLRNMGLQRVEDDFLSRFSNLVELDLSGNRLATIPSGVARLGQLQQLRLASNRIVLDQAADDLLARLSTLQLLDLDRNPLGRPPVLPARSRLRDVRLRSTGLEAMPQNLPLRGIVDLRENSIRQLRQDLASLRDQLEVVALHDNPLDQASESLLDQAAAGSATDAHRLPSFKHHSLDDSVRDAWTGSVADDIRSQRHRLWHTLQGETGSQGLFRFLADFSNSEDFSDAPERFRARVWRILEQCEQHELLRDRVFLEAAGPRTCEDRLLLVLEQMEISILAERATCDLPASQTESALLRLGRGLFRLDELDRIAARHVESMRLHAWALVDEVEIRLFYRLKLAYALDLPIEPETMHYQSFANVNTSDLLRARREVLAAENTQSLADSLSQRPFWEAYARHHYNDRFGEVIERFHTRLADLEAYVGKGAIDEWTFDLRSRALKDEYAIAERKLLRELAEEAFARV